MMLETIFGILVRGLCILLIYAGIDEKTVDRDKNPVQNGIYFSAFPFYIFILMSYQDYGETKLDFVMPIIINSIIFGSIAFLIGYMIIKFKK